ncbi:hypothetical protein ACFFKE_13170 [Streptomyces mutabilis]|uniref:hypothetical protein n=1 Tax=Streptomyces mutabilis TaxID=67332 RepID=UPI0019A9020C|nr:hypothetical protein [Streptomyces mutabilis]GGQ19020.1 hypothetical protein GCM10010279_28490 [Streptomyces mutabilis]
MIFRPRAGHDRYPHVLQEGRVDVRPHGGLVSLDGYASADGWPRLWGMEVPEYLAWLDEDSASDGTPGAGRPVEDGGNVLE